MLKKIKNVFSILLQENLSFVKFIANGRRFSLTSSLNPSFMLMSLLILKKSSKKVIIYMIMLKYAPQLYLVATVYCHQCYITSTSKLGNLK